MGQQTLKQDSVKSSVPKLFLALALGVIGVAIAGAGIYVGDTDDAPGAALIGIVFMIGMLILGVRTMRRKAQRPRLATSG
jgi:peptidoglycan/LPS O-acetylase OafA/YrhL